MSKLIKEIMDALNAVNQNKTQPYDRQGEVKRIEGKIAWVKLEGSDLETPVQMTIACEVGDTVQARIGGGSAWLTGNLTAPPTDDKKATRALSMATTAVATVQETAEAVDELEEAIEDIDSSEVDDVVIQYCLSDSSSTFVQYGDWSSIPPEFVSGKYYWVRSVIIDDEGNETYGEPRYSQDTQLSVETDIAFASNNNHFWHDASGAYVTTADKSYASGYATRITSSGILQSYNSNLLSGWTSSGIAFYDGDGTTASNSTKLAQFGSGGVSLYENGNNVAYLASTLRLGRSDAANLQIPTVTSTQTGYHSDIEFYYNGIKNGSVTSGRNGSTFYTSVMADSGYLTINDNSGNVNVRTNGGFCSQNHSSPIGTVKNAYLTANKVLSADTAVDLCELDLEAGVWVVACGVRFPSNATGVRRANLSTTAGDADIHIQLSASSSNVMQLAFTRIVAPTSTATYYLNAWHNASSTLTLPRGSSGAINYMRAVRIE